MSHQARTDKNGRYEFSGVEPRDYTMRSVLFDDLLSTPPVAPPTWSKGGGPKSGVVTVRPSAHVRLADFLLPAPLKFAVLSGTVLDSAGRPAAKAWVRVLCPDDCDTIRTDENGRFSLSLLVGIHYQIESENHHGESTSPEEFRRVEDILATPNMSPLVIRLQREK